MAARSRAGSSGSAQETTYSVDIYNQLRLSALIFNYDLIPRPVSPPNLYPSTLHVDQIRYELSLEKEVCTKHSEELELAKIKEQERVLYLQMKAKEREQIELKAQQDALDALEKDLTKGQPEKPKAPSSAGNDMLIDVSFLEANKLPEPQFPPWYMMPMPYPYKLPNGMMPPPGAVLPNGTPVPNGTPMPINSPPHMHVNMPPHPMPYPPMMAPGTKPGLYTAPVSVPTPTPTPTPTATSPPATQPPKPTQPVANGRPTTAAPRQNLPDKVASLVEIGFKSEHATEALALTNNDVDAAIVYLSAYTALLENGHPPDKAKEALSLWNNLEQASQYLLAYSSLVEFGFTRDQIKEALVISDNDRDRALDLLLAAK